jgi:uncharacterized membrane protein
MGLAALLVFGVEGWAVATKTPLISNLSTSDRSNLYNQVVVVSAALLGFILTAITILVSLDGSRRIVKELRYGEAFTLLVVNMLATVALLLALTLLGIAATAIDVGSTPAKAFETWYEWVGIGTAFELILCGFYFSVAMYKVATYE